MACNHGKFISANFMNKKLKIFIDLDSEWLSYSDGDAQSYTILIATPIGYDTDSGIITMRNDRGQKFYMGEEFIKMFWLYETKFRLTENATSTIRPRKKLIDIM